jgi:hypothetical protein
VFRTKACCSQRVPDGADLDDFRILGSKVEATASYEKASLADEESLSGSQTKKKAQPGRWKDELVRSGWRRTIGRTAQLLATGACLSQAMAWWRGCKRVDDGWLWLALVVRCWATSVSLS